MSIKIKDTSPRPWSAEARAPYRRRCLINFFFFYSYSELSVFDTNYSLYAAGMLCHSLISMGVRLRAYITGGGDMEALRPPPIKTKEIFAQDIHSGMDSLFGEN